MMADAPNVLLLVVDSLRYDAVFGERDTDTPTIDALVEEGTVFSECYSQGVSTAPAMTALLTGRLPLDYGGHWYLEDDQPTFAEEFRRAGYRTGAVHSNPYVSSRRNFDRGFDVFDEDVVAFEPDRSLERAPQKLLRLLNRLSRIVGKVPYTPAETVNEKVFDFIEGVDNPWFCWAQYMDVHGPYLPGGDVSYRDKFGAELLWRKAAVTSPGEVTQAEHDKLWQHYRLEVEYVDAKVGDLLDSLDAFGSLSDTIVVVTADHGDEFFEHGRYGHGNLPYDELVHVPLVIWSADGPFSGPEDVGSMVRSIDVLPTVLDGVACELGDAMQDRMAGTSLLPLIDDPRKDVGIDRSVTEKRVRDSDALRIGFRTDRWKFIYDGKRDDVLLFDVTHDPAEQTDVGEQNPDVVERFQASLRARFDRIERTSTDVEVSNDEEAIGAIERLRALGYR